MTFYLDIILAENMIMNYIILFATGIIIKTEIKQLRILLSSLLGSIYVIMSYISGIENYINQITKIVLSITMIYIAFAPKNIKKLIKETIIFYLTSFSFGGTAYYLLYNISPNQINSINGILIGSYPIKIAVLGGILGFIIIYMSFKIIKVRINKNLIFYNVEIVINNKSCMVKTILDTGNLLVDPITSFPVIIVDKKIMKEVIPEDIVKILLESLHDNNINKIPEQIKRRCRFIPFSSIGKTNGIIIGVKPDYIKIYEEDDEIIKKDVIVGISNSNITRNSSYSGLIGLECLNNQTEKAF